MGLRHENVMKLMGACVDASCDCLCFTAVEPSTVRLNSVGMPLPITLEYVVNNGIWRPYQLQETEDGGSTHYVGQNIELREGDKLWMRNTQETYTLKYTSEHVATSDSRYGRLRGWARTALDGNGFEQNIEYYSPTSYYVFVLTGALKASGDVQTLMTRHGGVSTAYFGQFYGLFSMCTALLTPPELTAYTLQDKCYGYMFNGCTNLNDVKIRGSLNADTFSQQFVGMYQNCMSLTEFPDLSIEHNNYQSHVGFEKMFKGCVSLRKAPAITVTVNVGNPKVGDSAYKEMFENCTNLTDASRFTMYTSNTGVYRDYTGAFSGCTSLVQAPVIAFSIATASCVQLFMGCTSLRSITIRATLTSDRGVSSQPLVQMFDGCSSLEEINFLVTVPYTPSPNPNSIWNENSWGRTYLAQNWVRGVAETGVFRMYYDTEVDGVKSNSKIPAEFGVSKIPVGWTVEYVEQS